jgi:hypothetical protein
MCVLCAPASAAVQERHRFTGSSPMPPADRVLLAGTILAPNASAATFTSDHCHLPSRHFTGPEWVHEIKHDGYG